MIFLYEEVESEKWKEKHISFRFAIPHSDWMMIIIVKTYMNIGIIGNIYKENGIGNRIKSHLCIAACFKPFQIFHTQHMK